MIVLGAMITQGYDVAKRLGIRTPRAEEKKKIASLGGVGCWVGLRQ